MTSTRRSALMLPTFLIFSSLCTMAQGAYTQIDYPGSIETFVYGIDSSGDIAGWYVQTSGSHQGFFLSQGIFTTISYPDASDTAVLGMNDFGQFVGSTADPDIGFLYDSQNQTFTTIAYPAAFQTYPTAINNGGKIVGYFDGTAGNFGFELVGSTYRLVVPKGESNSTATGITSTSHVDASLNRNFVVSQEKYQGLSIPDVPSAAVAGINPAGTAIVGWYQPSSGIYNGYSYQNRVLQTLQFPGSTYTVANGVNDAGEVVGYFEDSNFNYHGFTWTPPVNDTKK